MIEKKTSPAPPMKPFTRSLVLTIVGAWAAAAPSHSEIEGVIDMGGRIKACRVNGWPNVFESRFSYLENTPLVVEVRDEEGDAIKDARVFVDRGAFRCEAAITTDYIGYALILNPWKSYFSRSRNAGSGAGDSYTVVARGYRPFTITASRAILPGPGNMKGSVPLLAVKLASKDQAKAETFPKKIR